ncbi:type I restriction-modification system subunit M [Rothia sp. ND6WE1A]|uniref:type I restriction-modification system subunit M n=1 Tax=Rothia sp. ND6WE1A TaxID=1848190 RepID=UPI000830F2D4|nr:type I restriction-modification system subunit M [Rothia sp. ND6WE1A]
MDKRQLANSIWTAANEMRGSLDATDYKDFILGFLFYKYLSDKEVEYFIDNGVPAEELPVELTNASEANSHIYFTNARDNLGYYIAYEDLFESWLSKRATLDVADISEGLRRFDASVHPAHQHLYKDIFASFLSSIRKLGDNASAQAKKLRAIMNVIKDVPTGSGADYDILGYVYEYLIGKFAANAGKKNGEFYTPHTVALAMAEIVAHHVAERDAIEIYDPTSGSGSLLLNIGQAVERRAGRVGSIRYYAQELKQDAYNLTRMNLVMRGMEASNIVTRRGDSLDQDWPMIDKYDNYNLLRVDAVVSNPPYSAKWDRDQAQSDPRFTEYGLAPETKADYAFLLHELYHLKDDGIMTIILPHGVLFRGGEEEKIRRHLIEKNNIEAVIGLPANIFFGTGISTIVMVLKKQRSADTGVLFVDASKGFVKAGTKNDLRPRDVRKIVDTVIERRDVKKYSRVVSRDEIRENDYNLNIPRYVDSSEDAEYFDIFSTMFGGIPHRELDYFKDYWTSLPGLRESIFEQISPTHSQVRDGVEITSAVQAHESVADFTQAFTEAFEGFEGALHTRLIENIESVDLLTVEADIRAEIFDRLAGVPLVDDYEVYQHFADAWAGIENDLEVIKREGWDATREVVPNMVVKTKNKQKVEVQDGWLGKVFDFELVQKVLLNDDLEAIQELREKNAVLAARLAELFESVDEEDYEQGDVSLANAKGDAFAAAVVKAYAKSLKKNREEVAEGSLNEILVSAAKALEDQAKTAKDLKTAENELEGKTITAIASLTDEQVMELLHAQWITGMVEQFFAVPGVVWGRLIDALLALESKYATTLEEVNTQIEGTQAELATLMGQLTGSDADMKGIAALAEMFGGKN